MNIPRQYLALFMAAPLVLIPFVVFGTLTRLYRLVFLLLFVAFIVYVASRELKRTTPVFRNAEILEKVEVSAGSGTTTTGTGKALTSKPPFIAPNPVRKTHQIPG